MLEVADDAINNLPQSRCLRSPGCVLIDDQLGGTKSLSAAEKQSAEVLHLVSQILQPALAKLD